MYNLKFEETTHQFEKQNLITLSKGNMFYDEYKCKCCGLKGKSYRLGHITISGQYSKRKAYSCPKTKPIRKIQITQCNAFSPIFENLKPGSVHEVVDPPEGFDNSGGVWVMGVGEKKVKVLHNEYKEAE